MCLELSSWADPIWSRIPGPQNEKNKAEFVTSLRDVCLHLVHSHDGARLTMQVIDPNPLVAWWRFVFIVRSKADPLLHKEPLNPWLSRFQGATRKVLTRKVLTTLSRATFSMPYACGRTTLSPIFKFRTFLNRSFLVTPIQAEIVNKSALNSTLG